MTDTEKLELIRKLVLNLPIIDFTNQDMAVGAGHALEVAIELILESKEE